MIPADKKIVFICGLHRSGTSLLFQLLRQHPMMTGFQHTGVHEDEGQHLQSVFLPAKAYGGPGRFGFHPKSYLDEKSSLVSEANAAKLFKEWSQHWDMQKPILLEKSPPTLVRTRFFQSLFPNSYFIVMMRHPIPVSLSTRNWTGQALEEMLEHWLICYERFEMDRDRLSRVHILKYENLVNFPAKSFDEIFQFIGVSPHPLTLEIDTQSNARYFQQFKVEEKAKVQYLNSRFKKFGYILNDML